MSINGNVLGKRKLINHEKLNPDCKIILDEQKIDDWLRSTTIDPYDKYIYVENQKENGNLIVKQYNPNSGNLVWETNIDLYTDGTIFHRYVDGTYLTHKFLFVSLHDPITLIFFDKRTGKQARKIEEEEIFNNDYFCYLIKYENIEEYVDINSLCTFTNFKFSSYLQTDNIGNIYIGSPLCTKPNHYPVYNPHLSTTSVTVLCRQVYDRKKNMFILFFLSHDKKNFLIYFFDCSYHKNSKWIKIPKEHCSLTGYISKFSCIARKDYIIFLDDAFNLYYIDCYTYKHWFMINMYEYFPTPYDRVFLIGYSKQTQQFKFLLHHDDSKRKLIEYNCMSNKLKIYIIEREYPIAFLSENHDNYLVHKYANNILLLSILWDTSKTIDIFHI